MKKRNKYWQRDKEYLRLLDALHENHVAQRNLGYVKLDQPVPQGFNAFFVLRADVARRDDAWVFQTIIDLCGHTAWRRKNNFETVKERRTKPWQEKESYYDYPHFWGINEEAYLNLPPAVRRWFTEDIDKWGRKGYTSNVPNFFFEVEVVQYYRTHGKVIDEVLLQEEAEFEDKIRTFRDQKYFHCSGTAPAFYVRFWNVSDRRNTKQALHRMISQGKEDVCFPGRPRHAAQWAWW